MTRRVGDDARPDGARPAHELGIGPGGNPPGPICVSAADACPPGEAVSRAPVLRFVAALSEVSGERRLIDDGGKGASIASSNKEEEMPNPGQPLIRRGDQGTAVFRAQRALRRTPDLSVALDGDFGPDTEAAVERFQEGAGLDVDGIVDLARTRSYWLRSNEATRTRVETNLREYFRDEHPVSGTVDVPYMCLAYLLELS